MSLGQRTDPNGEKKAKRKAEVAADAPIIEQKL